MSVGRRSVPRLTRAAGIAVVAAVAIAGSALGVRAHPLDPSLLQLQESEDGEVDVLWRMPLTRFGNPPGAALVPVLPATCRALSSLVLHQAASTATLRWRVRCGPGGLAGARIGIEGLDASRTDALLRIEFSDGRQVQTVLRPRQPFFTVPARSSAFEVGRSYLVLGFEHILTGLDHLLFVLGLVLLVRNGRRLLWTVTAFTLGHSVTLSLAVLGVVHVPPAPTEVLIAASIFVVAVKLTRDAGTLGQRRIPWAIAGAFGLLHGLGFAGTLAQVGLPSGEIPLALFSFNVGIELGQLLFVVGIIVARAVLSGMPIRWPRAAAQVPAYAIGTLAVFWMLERVSVVI